MPFRRLWLQKNMSGPWFTNAQIPTDVRNPTTDSNTVKSHVVESQADSQGLQGLDRQQHPHFSQTSFPPYGSSGSNYSAFSTTNFSSSTSMRPELHDSQMRQAPAHPNMTSNHLGPTIQNTNVLNMAKFERPPSFSDAKKMQEPVDQSSDLQLKAQLNSSQGLSNLSSAQSMMSSLTAPVGPGNYKAPLKKPLVSQKKQIEAPGSSPPRFRFRNSTELVHLLKKHPGCTLRSLNKHIDVS